VDAVGENTLMGWVVRKQPRRRARPGESRRRGLRFVFYGRTSTEDYQDRASSRYWQRDVAENVISGRGVIVAEFFDSGYSRRLPWADRPEAAALLRAVANPDRGFDAIVVGEFERALYGDQLRRLLPVFDRYGVQVWLPETDGPLDLTDATHQALMLLLGAQSRREVLRSRHRVSAAMRAQVCEQGRYLGGRPPYGYRLVDAGPHPNRAHAQWGRRLRRLDPDPATAPHVRWMFAQRLAGRSVAGIARELNERGVPCPSYVDPDRNPHRSGEVWTLRTVAAILANPRYTGRQVWNRQGRDHEAKRGGQRRGPVYRWNPVRDWVISKQIVHPPLVTEQDFVAAQAIRASRPTEDGTTRTYLLAGLVRCRLCGRRMDAHWVNGRAGYRCRHGHTSAQRSTPGRPKNLYVREDHILASLPTQIAGLYLDDEPNPGQEERADGGQPRDHAELMRQFDLTIVCDTTGWTVQKDPGSTPHDTDRQDDHLKPGEREDRSWGNDVSEGGLEPPRPLRALAPQASASAIPPPGPALFLQCA
jgi:site-specific DNA recombinase